MECIKITRRPKLRNPYFIVAWPGMGEVAFKSATYLVEQLKAQEFARIVPENFFYLTGSIIKDGLLSAPELPYSKFYYWKNPQARAGNDSSDVIIFVSNAQPDLARADEYCKSILSVAASFKARLIISIAAMPQPIDHTQDPAVWVTGTSQEVNERMKRLNVRILSEGQISGMNGLFLGLAKSQGFDGFCILGEIPLYTIQIENPKASFAVLESLAEITGITVPFDALVEAIHNMEGEINKLLDYLKLGTHNPAQPIGEEEIERIKKSLSQLTKLPFSVKEKIEKLFVQARGDLSKANELKAELDKWNVYKEYEDRFLDLFQKPKEKDN